MFEVVFSPAAALELVEAYDWYEAESPGLGGRFQAEIDITVERMTANPLQFPTVLRGARRALLRRFQHPSPTGIRPQKVTVSGRAKLPNVLDHGPHRPTAALSDDCRRWPQRRLHRG